MADTHFSGPVHSAGGFVGDLTSDSIAAITTLTDSSGGTANDTIAAISGSGADADINNNFADLAAKINAILAALS